MRVVASDCRGLQIPVDWGEKYHSNNSDNTRVYNPQVEIAKDNRATKEKFNELR